MPSVTDSAPATLLCQNCGAVVPQGADVCPACGRVLSTRSSKTVLAVTLFLIFAGFAVTQYIVNLHRVTEAALAVRWFNRGDEAMKVDMPALAANDYRTALSYDRENRQYRLRLAEALLADNRLNEASAHLLSLWDQEPADGEVNLTLARLSARRGDFPTAVRYYSNAINGVWSEQPRSKRIAARFELTRLLMQHQQRAQARAELIALQADGSPDPADQQLLGQMLLQVNEPARAIDAYDQVLANDPANSEAWMGKGEALLSLANYAEAERAFAKAAEKEPAGANAEQQLALVREILRSDPAIRGLSLAERANRVSDAFDSAMKRLISCATRQGIDLTMQKGGASRRLPEPKLLLPCKVRRWQKLPLPVICNCYTPVPWRNSPPLPRRLCAKIPTRWSRPWNTFSRSNAAWKTLARPPTSKTAPC